MGEILADLLQESYTNTASNFLVLLQHSHKACPRSCVHLQLQSPPPTRFPLYLLERTTSVFTLCQIWWSIGGALTQARLQWGSIGCPSLLYHKNNNPCWWTVILLTVLVFTWHRRGFHHIILERGRGLCPLWHNSSPTTLTATFLLRWIIQLKTYFSF